MNTSNPKVLKTKKILTMTLIGVLLFLTGIGGGLLINRSSSQSVFSGYAQNPEHEFLVGAAAWQMSAEAHALILQGFHIAEENITDMVAKANSNLDGYHWFEENNQKELYLNNKRVCVICDIDDTLVDGVHYTANILGKNGEWTNKAFTDFIQSEGCTALPGAVSFTNYCVKNGIALFYVTNRYDQGYKLSETGYAGQEGYKKSDGTIIGSSTYDIFGKTIYDITMSSMSALGFPTNDPNSSNYYKDAYLIVNDTKLNGSSKEGIRNTIASGGILNTGERVQESSAYPETINLNSHHVSMLLGDDLNDISQCFSDSSNAVERIELTLENLEKWGSEWIVFPNVVYGSSINYATQYGYSELFEYFDYTIPDNNAWNLYKQED